MRDRLLALAAWTDGGATWTQEHLEEYMTAVHAAVDDLGPDACLEAALHAWTDEPPPLQAVALDVLGVLVDRQAQLLPLLLTVVDQAVGSNDENVRWAAANALDHGNDPRAVPHLVRMARDEDRHIRWKAVGALPLLIEEPTLEHPAVQALLDACADDDPDVRDWAVFGLGVLLDVDGPEVRDALCARLNDEEADTAGEAAVGLARRRDGRVLPVLLRELTSPDVGNLYVEAAAELGDPRLLPLLQQLQARGWQEDHEPRPNVLDEALRRCTPGDP